MRLRALRLWNVRRFSAQGIAIEGIGDGVNVLTAENERGKSTCFDALHALFFQPHSGTPAAVRLLRPYSGGSPQIEADVETPDGVFRVGKRFYAGKRASVMDLGTGRLVAQADEAEVWIRKLIRGGASGPAGLLWVQQGVTDIGGGTVKEKDDERTAREDVLTSVAGEVEVLTGGRRMVRVMARCDADLDRLVTSTGRPKVGGPYVRAIEDLRASTEREQDLSDHLHTFRLALEERDKKARRLNELGNPDAMTARREEQSRTAEALAQAKLHSEKLKAAESGVQLETVRHQTAMEELNGYSQGLARAAELTKDLAEKDRALSEAGSAQAKAVQADAAAASTLERAEGDVETARTALASAEAARRAAESESQLSELRDRLDKAAKARARVETFKADHAALDISGEAVVALEALERAITAKQAAVAAAAVTVKMDYAAGREGAVLRDGIALSDGEALILKDALSLDVTDVGVLTVSPGAGEPDAAARTSLSEAEEERRKILADLGVENLGLAQDRQRQAAQKAADLREANAELLAFAPDGLEALRARVSQLEKQVYAVQLDVPDLLEAEASLKHALGKLNEARTEREIARSRLATGREALMKAEREVMAERDELSRTDAQLGSVDQRDVELQKRSAASKEAAQRLKDATGELEALRTDAPDLDTVIATATRAATALERAQAEMGTLEIEIGELTGRITTYTGDAIEEAFEDAKGQREAAEKRVAAFEAEVAALSRLKQALEEARGAAKEQYFGPVMEELKPLLHLLLDEASITFDDATLLPQSLKRDGLDEDVTVLSGGMREQLAILTRLAFARLLAKDGRSVPVILDDALVYSDDDRIERMFDALHRQAQDLQILVFTCRQRAFERLGGQGLRMVDWQPDS